jgi:protein TonB
MRGTLLESNAPRQRRRAASLASILVHTALIGGAIVATASAEPRAPRRMDSPGGLIYVRPAPPPPDVKLESLRERFRDYRMVCRMGFLPVPSLAALRYVPDSLAGPPLVDVDPVATIARDSTAGRCIGSCPRAPDGAPTEGGSDEPATMATVDRPAALRSPPSPRYPEQLRAARVTGRVVARFIVDTTGRIEPASIVIRESSHDLFARAVLAVLPGLRFVPAEVGRGKVRMLVDLPFEFRLKD